MLLSQLALLNSSSNLVTVMVTLCFLICGSVFLYAAYIYIYIYEPLISQNSSCPDNCIHRANKSEFWFQTHEMTSLINSMPTKTFILICSQLEPLLHQINHMPRGSIRLLRISSFIHCKHGVHRMHLCRLWIFSFIPLFRTVSRNTVPLRSYRHCSSLVNHLPQFWAPNATMLCHTGLRMVTLLSRHPVPLLDRFNLFTSYSHVGGRENYSIFRFL